ncbi:hypothetical protein ACLEJQ_22205 [Pseudomonas sp. SMV71]|uniref:hypothetical protein n=1 Tax=Pseudomonas sp. SMV71 TaxID=3390195 RepID=UPI003F84EEA3
MPHSTARAWPGKDSRMPTGNDPLRYIVNHSDRSERMVLAADFDRVVAENQALQQRLTTADQRIDELEGLVADITKRHWSVEFDLPFDLVARIKALSASAEPAKSR